MLSYAAENDHRLPRWNAGQPAVPGANYQGIGENENPPWARILIDAGFLPDKSKLFVCPADVAPNGGKRSTISYAMNANVADQRLTALFQPSKTIVVTERYGKTFVKDVGVVKVVRSLESYAWAAMVGSEHVGASHQGKAVFAFADGHVEMIVNGGDPTGNDIADASSPPASFWAVAP